jgi:RNA polymerase sigma-70 factor (ECF subfamily)
MFMQVEDDWDCVARARDGDIDAFAEIVRRYELPLRRFCARMVASREEGEDLAQESFLRLHRYLHRLKPRAKFSTVLFGIARNLTLNHLRDEARRGRGKRDPIDEHTLTAPLSRKPDRQAVTNELAGLIEDALGQLRPEHREILLLREVEGLDYDAIAQVLRCRKGTVRSRLSRAREQLRTTLEAMGARDR